jgi:3-hexulose-6-phosphate synthase/6-phospho-3-hexuloisomerase
MRKIVNPRVEIDSAVVSGFRDLLSVYSTSCVVTDVMERAGVMHTAIRCRCGGKMAGPAVTVRLYPGDLVDPLPALTVAAPGDVVVVDAAGETETSVWGGLMAGLGRQRGIAGAIVDGAVRDIDEIRDLQFNLFSRAVGPRASHTAFSGRHEPIEVNVPIHCGGVLVQPGDVVVADEIGVVVVPRLEAREVLARAREQADREEATRRRIQEGKTMEELLAEFGRL